ncbi:gamma-glutamylcyclotransferase family protein [Francisella sp. TX07-6608]|uniref:gamma-glutamylcyclotransferase family protein n=1 Tax=Francisella sp. TX07-6608 TaxID=573568 RepID=UPI0008F9D51C|nr:gamma-glutamylcyclotransferase family protein [Francisella sp. TX07-6608]OIN83512.1 AIG2-like family protein [Francisella sp. TX07-6608]
MELLFSYGTLQQEEVQLSVFGRKLVGQKDSLKGYIVSEVEILDQRVIKVSGKKYHPILKKTENILDEVHGTIFELTTNEIKLSDKYEVDSYVRKKVTLNSGNSAWIYTEAV